MRIPHQAAHVLARALSPSLLESFVTQHPDHETCDCCPREQYSRRPDVGQQGEQMDKWLEDECSDRAGAGQNTNAEGDTERDELAAFSMRLPFHDDVPDLLSMEDDVWNLDSDEELCQEFRRRGIDSPFYRRYLNDYLLPQCIPVVDAWLRTGTFFIRSKKIDRGVGYHDIPVEDIEDLSNDIVFAAERRFTRDGIFGNQWAAEAGASLTTYFLNACILEFANVFRKWRRHKMDWHEVGIPVELEKLNNIADQENALYKVEYAAILRTLLTRLTALEKTVLFYHYMCGYTYAEIAVILGSRSEKAISRISENARKKAKFDGIKLGISLDTASHNETPASTGDRDE